MFSKIITSRGTSFTVGEMGEYMATVEKITFVIGDPAINMEASYKVEFDNGDIVEVSDVVEVWYRS